MASVKVVHWNPPGPIFKGHIRMGPRINNFGDLLGPLIVEQMLQRHGILREGNPSRNRRLLAVGSILQFAREGDTIWGVGANGKSLTASFKFRDLDVRAVRGPRTRDLLMSRGISTPAVYGDPGLLLGHLWKRDELARAAQPQDVVVIPNFHDFGAVPRQPGLLNPRSSLWGVIGAIAASKLVVGSSLHAIVIAESLGVPARLVASGSEAFFKYQDYFEGTGRPDFEVAPTIEDAIRMGGENTLDWDPAPLVDAFPVDLWRSTATSPTTVMIDAEGASITKSDSTES